MSKYTFPPIRDLSVELTAFYSLIHIDWLVSRVMSRGKNRIPPLTMMHLQERTQAYLEVMEVSLSRIIFDYLFLACLGEARHAPTRCTTMFSDFNSEWDGSSDRQCVVSYCAGKYDPKTTLPLLIKLFNEGDWHDSYGGKRWGEIAQAAYNWYTHAWNDITLIDHCVDMVHNGGLAFDKGFLLTCSERRHHIQNLLDDKASRKPLHKWRGSPQMGGCVRDLITQLQRMHLVKTVPSMKWCEICQIYHVNKEESDSFLFVHPDPSRRARLERTLADDGYLGIEWPSDGSTPGELVDSPDVCGGCWLNGEEPCDGDCSNCPLNHGGCELNGWEPCDGDCSNCDFNHGGCEHNYWEPCNGDCSDCPCNEKYADDDDESDEQDEESEEETEDTEGSDASDGTDNTDNNTSATAVDTDPEDADEVWTLLSCDANAIFSNK